MKYTLRKWKKSWENQVQEFNCGSTVSILMDHSRNDMRRRMLFLQVSNLNEEFVFLRLVPALRTKAQSHNETLLARLFPSKHVENGFNERIRRP